MVNAQVLKELQATIKSEHRLTGGAKGYLAQLKALHGDRPYSADSVGEVPGGFGPVFDWDRDAFEQVNLSVFVHAADHLGAMITGVRATDRITVTSASGVASFTRADPLCW
jgi:hypothetical protein